MARDPDYATFELEVDAFEFASGWLAAFVMCGQDDNQVALYRAVIVDVYRPRGRGKNRTRGAVRCTSLDGYALLTAVALTDPDPSDVDPLRPGIDEAPAETWTVTDGDYRMRDLIKYIRAESARDEPTITRVTIGTTTSAEVGAFAGMERPMFFVDTGTERVEIPIYDGAAMAWRSVLASHTPAPADRFSVSLDRIRTLGKIPNALAVTLIMGAGDRGRGLVRVEGFGASVPVEGAFMPQHVADAGDAEPEDA